MKIVNVFVTICILLLILICATYGVLDFVYSYGICEPPANDIRMNLLEINAVISGVLVILLVVRKIINKNNC